MRAAGISRPRPRVPALMNGGHRGSFLSVLLLSVQRKTSIRTEYKTDIFKFFWSR